MPTLRERIANVFYGDKVRRVERLTEELIDIYRRQPYTSTPEQLLSQLKEVDSQYIDLLLRQIRDRETTPDPMNRAVRMSVVAECRSLYVWDVLSQNIVDLWTDYGFGTKVLITTDDRRAQPAWDEFWTAKRNSQVIGDRDIFNLSTNVLVDGEFYFAFFTSRIDGKTSVRIIPTDEITETITKPDDKYMTLYYKREYVSNGDSAIKTVYYPDWQASPDDLVKANLPEGSVIADQVKADLHTGTDVVMMQVSHRERYGHGWPLMTAGASWSRAYRNFLQDRAAVARAVAMYVDKIKVKGSSRTVDMIQARLQSSLTQSGSNYETNPPPVAGSDWIENDALSRQRMPMNTGGADAEKDGTPLLAQAGLSGRIFPHYLGRGESFRLATATAMEGPTLRAFKKYQMFWSSVWQDMAEIVLGAIERYGGESFSTYAISVSTDSILQVDIEQVSQLLGKLKDVNEAGLIIGEEATNTARKLMQAGMNSLGIAWANDILPDAVEEVDVSERMYGSSGYRSSLRNAVYGLWSGKIAYNEFVDMMESTVDGGLHTAWKEAMESLGIPFSERTMDEEIELGKIILEQFGYIDGFGEYILANNKASGSKLGDLSHRLDMWANRYNEVYNRALAMAGQNMPLEWVMGATEHCATCQSLSGKVKRASFWEKFRAETGIYPQSSELQCKGFNCACSLLPTNKPLTRGRLPIRK